MKGDIAIVNTYTMGARVCTIITPSVKGKVTVAFEDGVNCHYLENMITVLSKEEQRIVRRLYNFKECT